MSSEETKKKKVVEDSEAIQEFGGPLGGGIIIVCSHILVFYLWYCLNFHKGEFIHPYSEKFAASGSVLGHVQAFVTDFAGTIRDYAQPTRWATMVYLGFLTIQALFAMLLPGLTISG